MRLANFIKRIVRNVDLKKHKSVQIKSGACVTVDCEFEGNNIVYEDCYLSGCYIGFASYIHAESSLIKTKVGKYCSIAPKVRIVSGNHPTHKIVSTHPLLYAGKQYGKLKFSKKTDFAEYSYVDPENKYYVEIGNDVWIGDSARIINGVTIGNGAIIAAGAYVTKDVQPYSIVGGVPARVISYRFNQEQIACLQKYKWWDKDPVFINDNIECFWDIERMMEMINNEHDQAHD